MAVKGTVSRDFLLLVFHESVYPQPSPLGPFQIFSKICGDIRKSKCTTSINDTGAIFHRCQRHRRQILPPVLLVLLIPVANLPPVSTIPAANFATSFTSVVDTSAKFATGVNYTCGKFCHQFQ
jgi:hypothetical protein